MVKSFIGIMRKKDARRLRKNIRKAKDGMDIRTEAYGLLSCKVYLIGEGYNSGAYSYAWGFYDALNY